MGEKEKCILYSFLAWLIIIGVFLVNSSFNFFNANFIAFSIASALFIFFLYNVYYEKKCEKEGNMQNFKKELLNHKERKKYIRCTYTKSGNVIYLKKKKRYTH